MKNSILFALLTMLTFTTLQILMEMARDDGILYIVDDNGNSIPVKPDFFNQIVAAKYEVTSGIGVAFAGAWGGTKAGAILGPKGAVAGGIFGGIVGVVIGAGSGAFVDYYSNMEYLEQEADASEAWSKALDAGTAYGFIVVVWWVVTMLLKRVANLIRPAFAR